MGKKNKVTMPMSTAGLVRYFDDYKEKIQIKPEYVLYFSAALAAIEIIVRLHG